MGKRKSRAKPATTKRMDKLDTVFSCPFCNHGSSVECQINMKEMIGIATCRICEESFSTTITGFFFMFSILLRHCCCFINTIIGFCFTCFVSCSFE
ncbi:unnamed protein product [Brassica oleracea]